MKLLPSLRNTSVGLACLFLVLCVAFASWPRLAAFVLSYRVPTIACDDAVYDFGELASGKSFEHVFILNNTGRGRLEIKNIQPGCGCSTVDMPEKSIPGGTSVALTANVSLKNMRGPFHKRIAVSSNDPKQATFMLTIKGHVISRWDVFPPGINLGKILPTSETMVTVIVRPREGRAKKADNLRIKKVVCESPYLVVETKTISGSAETRDSNKYTRNHAIENEQKDSRATGNSARTVPEAVGTGACQIKVRTKGPLPVGLFRATVRVETNDPDEAQILIPVLALVEK